MLTVYNSDVFFKDVPLVLSLTLVPLGASVFFLFWHAETKMQHEGEINGLESMMRSSQETLQQMVVKHKQAVSVPCSQLELRS